jgi:iron complex transport system permease protein
MKDRLTYASAIMSAPAPLPRTATRPAGALRRRRLLVVLGLALGLVLCCLASVAVGARAIPLDAVWHALVAPAGTEDDVVVLQLRVPRTLFGLLVGAALGVAGALIQGHTRNPLADPGLLGVNAGAGLFVVLAIYWLGITSPLGYVWFALAGALVAAVVVFLAGSAGRGGPTPVTLALAGAAVSALLIALTSAVILVDVDTLDAYRFWVVGSLAGRDLAVLDQVQYFVWIGLLIALVTAPALNALALGEDVARALGYSVGRIRLSGIVAITLLAGAATAMCGPISFLGLVVPHVVRGLTGPDYRWLLPCAAGAGALLLLLADVLGRVVVRPGELQVGIVLALLGGPFFIALVRRRAMAAV